MVRASYISLIDQLCKAIQDWEKYVQQQGEAPYFFMVWTGGVRYIRPEGAIDPSTLSAEERKKLTIGQIEGNYTVDQVKKWLEALVREVGVFEEFLVISLIKAFEEHLEKQAHDYAKKPRKARTEIDRINKLLNDPRLRTECEKFWKQERSKLAGKLGFGDVEERDFAQSMQRLSAFFREKGEPKLSEMRERMDSYKAWQIVTEQILDTRNRDEWWDRWSAELMKNLDME
jgi:hypothetical protein